MTLRHRLAAGFAVTAALFWSAGTGLTGAAAAVGVRDMPGVMPPVRGDGGGEFRAPPLNVQIAF